MTEILKGKVSRTENTLQRLEMTTVGTIIDGDSMLHWLLEPQADKLSLVDLSRGCTSLHFLHLTLRYLKTLTDMSVAVKVVFFDSHAAVDSTAPSYLLARELVLRGISSLPKESRYIFSPVFLLSPYYGRSSACNRNHLIHMLFVWAIQG